MLAIQGHQTKPIRKTDYDKAHRARWLRRGTKTGTAARRPPSRSAETDPVGGRASEEH